MVPSHQKQRAAELYWNELVQLKGRCVCIRLYRDRLRARLKAVEIVKAMASSGAIGAWAVFQTFPILWSSIIALAQVIDVLKGVFPFARDHRAANDLNVALSTLYVDAEEEWEAIWADILSGREISKRRTRLRKLQMDAEQKYFPDGFLVSDKIKDLAIAETEAYFAQTSVDGDTR